MSRSKITSDATKTLRAAISGDVFVPGDDGYDEARRAWNLAKDQQPAVVVFPECATDVARAVQFARSQGMPIAPQATGHGAGPLEPLESAMLLKTSRMRRVDMDPAARTARIEAGAIWRDVTVPAGQHGLAPLAGTSPDVGVTGYTLGGGLGWLARRYGLAANSVTAANIVTPEGDLVRANADQHPELLWAVRGGGGVGVVTALDVVLYPVRQPYAGALFFPIERSFEVLHGWREWTGTVPDEMTSIGRLMRFPSIPEVPEQLRGRAFALVEAAYLGDAAAAAEVLRPLRQLGAEIDTFAAIPASALSQLHMDPDHPVPNHGDGALLADLPAAAIDALLTLAGPDAKTPLASIEIRHLGGALSRPARTSGAQPTVDAGYLTYAAAATPTPELAAVVRAHIRALMEALTPWRAGYDYYNLTETPAGARAVLPAGSYDRLQQINAAYDAGQAIVSAHPVWPARR